MKVRQLFLDKNPLIFTVSSSLQLLPIWLTSAFIFFLSTFGYNNSHAISTTQQSVLNYFTDPSLCNFVFEDEVGEKPIDEEIPHDDKDKKKGLSHSGYLGKQSIPVRPSATGSYECSNLRTAEGEMHFQAGIERLLNSPETLDLEAVLQGFAFEEVITMGTLNVEINGAHMANLNAHVDDLHHGGIGMRHPSVSSKRLSTARETGGGAAVDNKKMGFFINSRVDTGEKDVSSQETGFDFDAYGLTAGVDVRLNNHVVVGFAAGYGNTKADYTSSIGSMEMDGYSLSFFGTLYEKDKYYLDGIVNYTHNQFDSSRTFVTPNNVTQTAIGETDGGTLTVGLGLGYEEHIKDVTVGPFMRLNYTRVDIDAFSETGAGLVGLEVDRQVLTSFEGIVGFQASKIINQPWGVFIPQIRLELVHEFENENRIVNARFLGAVDNGITTTLKLPTDRPDLNYLNLALGASAQFSHGRTAFVQYSGLFAQQDIDEHALELGVRWSY